MGLDERLKMLYEVGFGAHDIDSLAGCGVLGTEFQKSCSLVVLPLDRAYFPTGSMGCFEESSQQKHVYLGANRLGFGLP